MDTPPHLLLVVILTIYGHVESRQIHVERMLGNLHMYQETYFLPRLPYAYHKYEPWLDEYTIQQHHEGLYTLSLQISPSFNFRLEGAEIGGTEF